MGGFCSCCHVPDDHCLCPGCLLHKLKNKMQHANVYTQTQTETQTNEASSPNQQASSANPALPLNTASAASRPNDVAVSSIASSGQQNGERGRQESGTGLLQVQPEPSPQGDVHVDGKSLQGVQQLVSPNLLQTFKSYGYAKALSSGVDSFMHMFPSSDEADECPTCLEEYTSENPKIVAKCNHHYHLSCIYEWMERNENCPVCGKLMLFEE